MNIAIIYTFIGQQAQVNQDHGDAIAEALIDDHNILKYKLPNDLGALIRDSQMGKIDFVINNSCGLVGGDGTIEGLLNLLGLRYLGSGLLATAIGFDKRYTKKLLASEGLPIIQDLIVGQEDWKNHRERVLNRIQRKVGFPIIIKAVRGTDSIGMGVCHNKNSVSKVIRRVFKEDSRALIEQFIDKKVEITCMAYGNGKQLRAFDVVEYEYEGDILSSQQKMKHKDVKRISPARISQRLTQRAQKLTLAAHRILGCRDYSRTDMIIDKNNQIYILEVNIHAGLGKNSPTSISAKSTRGWNYGRFIKELIKVSLRRRNNF